MMKNSLLKFFGVIFDLTPLGIYVGINWDYYAPTTVETISLGAGGLMVVIMSGIVVYKKAIPQGMGLFVFIAVLAYLLEPILSDLLNLSLMILSGMALDKIFIQPRIEEVKVDKTAEKVAKAIGGRYDI